VSTIMRLCAHVWPRAHIWLRAHVWPCAHVRLHTHVWPHTCHHTQSRPRIGARPVRAPSWRGGDKHARALHPSASGHVYFGKRNCPCTINTSLLAGVQPTHPLAGVCVRAIASGCSSPARLLLHRPVPTQRHQLLALPRSDIAVHAPLALEAGNATQAGHNRVLAQLKLRVPVPALALQFACSLRTLEPNPKHPCSRRGGTSIQMPVMPPQAGSHDHHYVQSCLHLHLRS
jgi:hypothetical protein